MAYLTFETYKALGFDDMNQETFDKLEKRAEMALDHATNYFYQHHDLETDHAVRKLSFERAMALTIEQMDKTGILSEIDRLTFSNLSIGSTTMGFKDGATFNLVPNEALSLLGSVGLRYAGVNYTRHRVRGGWY